MTRIVYLLVLSVVLGSCSDKLTESKVEKLVKECLEKEPNKYKYEKKEVRLFVRYKTPDNDQEKLEKEGFFKIEKKGDDFYPIYEIHLEEKIKPFVIEKIGPSVELKLCSYEIEKIESIQEVPAYNIAKVQVTYKKVDKTPLYEMLVEDNNKADFTRKTITLRKTENKGWQYCQE